MSPVSSPARLIVRATLLGLALSVTAYPALAAPKEPKPETITVSARALKDDSNKLCMPSKDHETRKTVTMCLTREGWAAQGITIIVK